ncbi:GNAT family N-acetyltransferase [Brevibacillus reuszeri]|uniref:GNAT family N-acetyltransferase n=1 Tax=Brevibacillus reuszeri TaxID=54915 RepID=UPI002897843C|nr:GNAT family N-acetyltransferase [Brevibacillus reuszeri]
MIQSIAISNRETAKRVWALQQAAYAVEAKLIGWADLPPLRETVDELLECGEMFACFMDGAELAGAISFKVEEGVVDIHRMMVHPNHFRKGIASKLLQHVEAVQPEWQKMIVSTGALNEPATQLYQRHGFMLVEQKEVAPGLKLSFFEKSN